MRMVRICAGRHTEARKRKYIGASIHCRLRDAQALLYDEST